jgi:hypothetical protein
MSILGPSTSFLGPSTSILVHPWVRMILVLLTRTWILHSCLWLERVRAILQTCPWVLWALPCDEVITRYSYMLLYVMRIMNRCIVSLILIKFYVMLIAGLILLLMIEDVVLLMWIVFWCWKIGYLNCSNCEFLGQGVNGRRNCLRMSLLVGSQITFATGVLLLAFATLEL